MRRPDRRPTRSQYVRRAGRRLESGRAAPAPGPCRDPARARALPRHRGGRGGALAARPRAPDRPGRRSADRRGRAGPGLGAAFGRRHDPGRRDFFDALPRLRLVQLLSAGAEQLRGPAAATGCCSATPGGRTPRRRRSGRSPPPSPRSAGIPFFVREQEAGRWSIAHAPLPRRCPRPRGRRRRHRPHHRPDAGRIRRRAHLRRRGRPATASGPRRSCPSSCRSADVVILIVPVTPETTGHGRRRLPRRDARRRAAGERRARASSSTPTRCSPSCRPAGCGPRWTSPNPSRCRRGTRCGARPGCCSRRTSGERCRRRTPGPPRRSTDQLARILAGGAAAATSSTDY